MCVYEFVYLHGTRDIACALILIVPAQLDKLQSETGVSGDRKQVAEDESARQSVLQSVQAQGKQARLERFEIPKKVSDCVVYDMTPQWHVPR